MSIVSAVLLIPIVDLLYYNSRLNYYTVHKSLFYSPTEETWRMIVFTFFPSVVITIFMSLCLAFVLLYIKISQNRWNKAIDSMKPNMARSSERRISFRP